MVSTYTTNKNLEKPGNGDYVDTWNVPLNADMTAIDKALGSTLNLNATAGDATLSSTQYQNLIINVTGAMSASVTYTIPSGVGGQWIVRNATTDNVGGPWSVTIASAGGGSSVVVIRGRNVTVWSDGTNIRVSEPNIATIGTVTSVDVSGGTTGLTTSGGPVTSSGTITLAGTLAVTNGGTGAATLTGYVKGSGTAALTASANIPIGDISGLGTGIGTFLVTPSSANLAAAVTDETGTGALVFANSPSLTSPSFASITNTGTLTLPTATTTLVGRGTTDTLTNKRTDPRISSQANPASISVDISSYDQYVVTALAQTLSFPASTTGTPVNGNKMIIRIKDNGTARSISWTTTGAGSWRAIGTTLPTTTTINKVLYIGAIYNSDDAYWDVVAVTQQA